MAHARRKFAEAKGEAPQAAAELLGLLAQLYAIEAQARPMIKAAAALPLEQRGAALRVAYEERLQLRQKYSAPVMAQVKACWRRHKPDTLPKSALGEALQYMENQWAPLTYFLGDGAAEIDNNVAENAVRPLAVGRKNWLFLGNDEGGRRLAILDSLVESCRRNGVNPWDYFTDVLTRISRQPPGRLNELLPHRWKVRYQSAAVSKAAAFAAEVRGAAARPPADVTAAGATAPAYPALPSGP
jgi:hypothetical protein